MTAVTKPAGDTRPPPPVDFTRPEGEPALIAADSVSWRVFKNPVALYIGGIAAVLLELAEPRVRTGVWEHSSFRSDPLPRMKRTGLAAMVTVYGARSVAERMYPHLEPHGIVLEYLQIMARTRSLPGPLQPLAPSYLRAAVALLPAEVSALLGLDEAYRLGRARRALVKFSGALADRLPLRSAPPAQACARLGLPDNYLYRRRPNSR